MSQTNPSRYGGEAQLAAATRPEPEFEAIPLSQTNQTTEFGSFEEGEIQSASIPSVEVEQGSTPVTEPDYSQITATMGPIDWQTDLRMEIQDAGRRTNETMGGLLMTGIDRGINAADSIRTTLEAYGDDPSLIWSDVKDIAGSVATRLDDNFNEILFEWSYGSLGDREQYQASTARDIQAFENTVQSGIDKVQRIGDAIDRDDFRAVGEELFDPAVTGLVVLGTRGKGLPGPNSRGFISGDAGEVKKKVVAANSGDIDALGEINAAKALKAEGINVHFRKAAGDQGIQNVRTPDFFVGGDRGTGNGGQIFDVFSPSSGNAGRVVSNTGKKLSQTDRIILNLDNTTLTIDNLSNIIPRVNNIPGLSRPLQEVIFVQNQKVVGRVFNQPDR